MHMFGGFSPAFFQRYHQLVPRSEPREEYEQRVQLYEAYHHLNHALLFGVRGFSLCLLLSRLHPTLTCAGVPAGIVQKRRRLAPARFAILGGREGIALRVSIAPSTVGNLYIAIKSESEPRQMHHFGRISSTES